MRLSHCCASAITLRGYFNNPRKDSREIRAGATTRGWIDQGLFHPFLPLLLSISRNRSLSLGHLHGNSWCTYTIGRGVRPEARIETTSLPPWRTVEGCDGGWEGKVRGGRRMRSLRDEAAAGESVLRILEVMSRAVLYNTRSRPFQSRPLFSLSLSLSLFPSTPSVLQPPLLPPPVLRGSWWKMEIANPRRFSRRHRFYLSG